MNKYTAILADLQNSKSFFEKFSHRHSDSFPKIGEHVLGDAIEVSPEAHDAREN